MNFEQKLADLQDDGRFGDMSGCTEEEIVESIEKIRVVARREHARLDDESGEVDSSGLMPDGRFYGEVDDENAKEAISLAVFEVLGF